MEMTFRLNERERELLAIAFTQALENPTTESWLRKKLIALREKIADQEAAQ